MRPVLLHGPAGAAGSLQDRLHQHGDCNHIVAFAARQYWLSPGMLHCNSLAHVRPRRPRQCAQLLVAVHPSNPPPVGPAPVRSPPQSIT